MERIGYISKIKENEIEVYYLNDDEKPGIKFYDKNILDEKWYHLGTIVIEKDENLTVLNNKDFSNIKIDQFLLNLSVLIKREYQKYVKLQALEKKVLMNYSSSMKEVSERISNDLFKICDTLNTLIANLRRLGILEVVLKLSGLEEKEPEINYLDQSITKHYESVNLQEIPKEEKSVFQKVINRFRLRNSYEK